MYRIETNIGQVRRELTDLGRKQVPFALALALTQTAREAADAEGDALPRIFDRPTPFTQKAYYVKRATKTRPEAEFGVKRRQAEYLRIQAEGGIRRPSGRALVVPAAIRLNKYGNIPRGAVRRMAGKPEVFVASRSEPRTGHLPPGVYKRRKRTRGRGARGGSGGVGGGRIVQLVAFEASARYRKRFPFARKGEAVARRRFDPNFVSAMRKALATAR